VLFFQFHLFVLHFPADSVFSVLGWTSSTQFIHLFRVFRFLLDFFRPVHPSFSCFLLFVGFLPPSSSIFFVFFAFCWTSSAKFIHLFCVFRFLLDFFRQVHPSFSCFLLFVGFLPLSSSIFFVFSAFCWSNPQTKTNALNLC